MTVSSPIDWLDATGKAARIGHAVVHAEGAWRRVPVDRLDLACDWLAYHGAGPDGVKAPGEELLEFHFPCGRQNPLFPARLEDAFRELAMLAGTPDDMCLLYLHSGHQAEAKTPILQKLLQATGHSGAAYALRIETGRLPLRELAVIPSLLAAHSHLMAIHDPVERIRFASDRAENHPRFTLALFQRRSSVSPLHPRQGATVNDDPVLSV